MKTTKVTKKNIKRVLSVIEKEFRKSLSIYGGSNGNRFAYETKREIGDYYAMIYITPTRKNHAFITSSALLNVKEVYESSKWNQSMIYGIEICNSYDKDSKSYIPLPCICVQIEIGKDDEQQG